MRIKAPGMIGRIWMKNAVRGLQARAPQEALMTDTLPHENTATDEADLKFWRRPAAALLADLRASPDGLSLSLIHI